MTELTECSFTRDTVLFCYLPVLPLTFDQLIVGGQWTQTGIEGLFFFSKLGASLCLLLAQVVTIAVYIKFSCLPSIYVFGLWKEYKGVCMGGFIANNKKRTKEDYAL